MSKQKKSDEEERKELKQAAQIFEKLPVGVLLIMMTETSAAFVHPDRLEKLFRARGFNDVANEINRIMGKTGFWRTLVEQCFPRVSALPAFIEARMRSGNFYQDHTSRDYERKIMPLPASAPMFAVDQAWRDTMQYILSILKDVRVVIEVGTQFNSFGKWEPPLHTDDHTTTTCGDYTLSPHIITHSHVADASSEAPFLFYIDFTPTPDDDDLTSSDAEFDNSEFAVGFFNPTTLPYVKDLGKDAESENSAIGEMTRGTDGASVFKGHFLPQFPFNDVVKLDYNFRWTTNVTGNKFRFVIPHIRTIISTSLKLWPGRISNHVLHAIDLREEEPKFRFEYLPIRVEVYDGKFPAPRTILSLDVSVKRDIFPGEHHAGSLVQKIYERIRTKPVGVTMQTGNYRLEIPYEWSRNGSYKTIVLSPPGNTSRHMYIGEIVGPPRPYRPIRSEEPHYEWFTGAERGPKNIVIKVITPAKL